MSRLAQYSAVSLLPFLHFFEKELLFAAYLRQENIMHDRFWTGRIAEHVAVGQNLCYTWSIIGKEGDL
jgi:hypothetical protein